MKTEQPGYQTAMTGVSQEKRAAARPARGARGPPAGRGRASARQPASSRPHRPASPRPAPPRACASCPSSSGMLLPLLRSSCFPSSSPGGGGGGGGLDAGAADPPEAQLQRGVRGLPGPLERADVDPGADPRRAAEAEGAPGPGARGPGAGGGGRRAEREPYACMDPGAALQRRAGGGGGLGAGSPALSGGQARRRKQPPRPADFKLQVIIIGSRGVGKTSLMERFTDDTFCEACKSTVGKGAGAGPVPGWAPPPPTCPPAVPGGRCPAPSRPHFSLRPRAFPSPAGWPCIWRMGFSVKSRGEGRSQWKPLHPVPKAGRRFLRSLHAHLPLGLAAHRPRLAQTPHAPPTSLI